MGRARWWTHRQGRGAALLGHAALVVAFCLATAAASAHPDLDTARAAWLEGDFVGALARLDLAERNPSVTEADRVAIHWYRAASLYALGRTDDASRALDALLVLRPMFVPNRAEAPPDLRALFAQRQAAYQEANGITLGDAELTGLGLRVPVGGHVESLGQVVAFVRVPPDLDYQPVILNVVETYAQADLIDRALWNRVSQGGALEVVVEAHNLRGALAARSGDAMQPLRLEVDAEQAAAALQALPAPPQTTQPKVELPAPRDLPPPGPPRPANHYRFRIPPWFFMMVTTAVSAGCGALSFSGCTSLGFTTVLVVIGMAVSDRDPPLGPTAISGLITGLTCLISVAFCCTSVPLAGCASVLWVTDLFYVNPNEGRDNETLEGER